ncbi:MAG: 3D domain-containing protein [Myxococcales bacterium]
MRSRPSQPLTFAFGLAALLGVCATACTTAGSTWMNQPLSTGAWGDDPAPKNVHPGSEPRTAAPPAVRSRVITGAPPSDDHFVAPDASGAQIASGGGIASAGPSPAPQLNPRAPGGKVLGTFRNTYYDFPSEADFSGENVALKDPRCKTIKTVARSFYEAVCVQGSGTLSRGSTVSFAKRDCECAELCPRTGQRICFDELDARSYPWGRGATGRAITPLLTVAVDSDRIPLDTPVYIPEYDGVPRDAGGSATHDGCFIAQDRGVRVKGDHIDVFTGHRETTALWNGLVPSNRGVTVILDSPHCARASAR